MGSTVVGLCFPHSFAKTNGEGKVHSELLIVVGLAVDTLDNFISLTPSCHADAGGIYFF